MNAEFIEALNAIEKERGISKDILIDAFESALIAAYKRNYGAVGNVRATVDRDTGEVQIFASKTFRVYSATDISGMQLGGTIKNVFAIGAGLCEGLNLGDNAQAALLTRGLAEMTRIGVASGGRRETFMGLSGVGDLIVTCYSRHSRNQTVGRRLAEGKSLQEILDALGMVAEGVPNTLSVYEIARKLGVRTPLIDAVYSVLYESKPPMEALVELMTRDPRPELD